jgi:hypothetical protein
MDVIISAINIFLLVVAILFLSWLLNIIYVALKEAKAKMTLKLFLPIVVLGLLDSMSVFILIFTVVNIVNEVF